MAKCNSCKVYDTGNNILLYVYKRQANKIWVFFRTQYVTYLGIVNDSHFNISHADGKSIK